MMDDETAVLCSECGHDARAHTADQGCLSGWGQGPTSWRTACRCECFGYAGASAWVTGTAVVEA